MPHQVVNACQEPPDDSRKRKSIVALEEEPGRVDCLVKLGGAAITVKDREETLEESVLQATAQQVAAASSQCRLVVVHGAGSFGHFHASRSKVAGGWMHNAEEVMSGFVATRLSVAKLNQVVVEQLARCGVRAVGVGALGAWSTSMGRVVQHDGDAIQKLVANNLTPVVHGDCVLDERLGCTILGGDAITETLAAHLRPRRVVFLTNVDGVFTKPPHMPGAHLVQEVQVDPHGGWRVIRTSGGDEVHNLEFDCSEHDVTGGLETKMKSAVAIAAGGVEVFVARAGSAHALNAMRDDHSTDWWGTWIRPPPQTCAGSISPGVPQPKKSHMSLELSTQVN